MAIGSSQPFRPAGTVALSATTASSNVRLVGGGDTVLITNATTSVAFVAFGADANVVAGGLATPVPPGAQLLLGVNSLISYAAAALVAGSGSVYFTRGDGSIY